MHTNKVYEEEQVRIIGVEETYLEQDMVMVNYLLKDGSAYTAIVELGDKLHGDINRFLLNPSISVSNTNEKNTELMMNSLMEHVKLFYRFNENVKYYRNKRMLTRQEHQYFDSMSRVLDGFRKRVLGQIKTARKLHLFDAHSTAFSHLLDVLENQSYLNGSEETMNILIAYSNDDYCLDSEVLKRAIYGTAKMDEWNNKVFGKVDVEEDGMPKISTTVQPVRIRK